VTVCEQAVMVGIALRRFRASPAALGRSLWRSVLAVAVMAAALLASGLGLAPAPTAPWRHLLAGIAVGAAVYAVALVLAWLAAGRPDGPERDLLTLAGRVLARLRALRLPRRLAMRSPIGRPR